MEKPPKNKASEEISATDYALLLNPLLNKGTAFTNQERLDFKLLGLIPPEQSTICQQRARSYEAFRSKKTNLEKYLYLRDLQDSNETLFYNLLCHHITEMMPIVYTPVVGEACQTFSHIYRRPRGLYIAYPYKDQIDEILANPRFDKVRVLVVSDGERILGLGDQGAGGMGIPIGKLALYCACSGLHPATTLPILLDTGTNNSKLIDDPLYLGWRHERVRGQDYDDFVEAFVQAIKKRFPHILLQWEDFGIQNATRLLDRYRNTVCSFNDDIQGTATIALGTLLSTTHITDLELDEQRIVIVGAGSAGCGIAELLISSMVTDGLDEHEARSHIYMVDRNGLLLDDMTDLLPFQKRLAQPRKAVQGWQGSSLLEVIKNYRPHTLLGVSGQAGLFSEELIRLMAAGVDRPVILPLSNPLSHSEATPFDLMAWTENRALIGTGSPYEPLLKQGKPCRVDQTNNVYIFPGIGLGLIAVNAQKVSDRMLIAAAHTLAACSPAKKDQQANLLPPLSEVRELSGQIAFAVAKEAVSSGLAAKQSDEEILKNILRMQWEPEYMPYRLREKI